MRNTLFLTLALIFTTITSQAAIFDAPDILEENTGAVSAMGEILLSDPTSEGVEAHGRYGLSDDLNLAAIFGMGSKGKQARFGAEVVYNFIPDWDGQIGISAVASALYLKRFDTGGVQMRVGPMIHKSFDGFSANPALVYLALPLSFEGRSGNYDTGGQIVLGSLVDLDNQSQFYAGGELGIKIANSDSYILAGIGMRFGELKFNKRERGEKRGSSKSGDNEDELRDEDFR